MNPEYPVYIISKGRFATRQTARALERIHVPYRIVIEEQEEMSYRAHIAREKILILPFSNLGQGSIPARNWVWEHSLSEGHKRHWILDDNLSNFYRWTRNRKIPVSSGTIFRIAEQFVDRYENVALAGFNYRWLCITPTLPAYFRNTRIYSCILIDNALTHRWRGRYNEDTDLSLRCLKDSLCTVLFNAFLCEKAATMTLKGGNTESLYRRDGRYLMAESLREQHPDCVTVTWKFNRWQHQVDYRSFLRNHLVRKQGIVVREGVNEHGMILRERNKLDDRSKTLRERSCEALSDV